MRKIIIFSFLILATKFRNLLSTSESTYKLLFIPGFEKIRWKIGKWKAWRVYCLSKRNVPAYSDFIDKNNKKKVAVNGLDPDLTTIHPTDKNTYVKKYSIESRCVGGALPRKGVVIDESSGTSGTPNNWVRGSKEREAIKTTLQTAVHHLVGSEPYIFINAFALGPWATGMNVSMSLVDIFILKSTGPDIEKIINTLNFFGPKYKYIIAGYPPFLKSLVDSDKVSWKKFDIIAFFGGEGMSEGMRTYLQKFIKKVYGSYGASDLEINLASENDFTIKLRELLMQNKALNDKLVHHNSLPMIFQYNPLDYYIETNQDGELLVTLCRPTNIAPKVRYNIHDLGHVVRMPELKAILKSLEIQPSVLGSIPNDLPLLFHYGRSDMAVAFYGSKITPADIEDIIFKHPMLSQQINSFSLIISEDKSANKMLTLALEMKENYKPLKNTEQLRSNIFEMLKTVNQDFRESSKMIPKGLEPKIEIHPANTGPFKINDIRLKKHYIQTR